MMRMHPHALLLLLFLCSVLAGGANAEPSRELTYKDCHPDDKAVLLSFPESWSSSWTPDTPCCDWFAIACDRSTGRIVGFSVFQDPDFTGTIPSAIAGLTHLQDLFLHHLPGLSGPIPPEIGKLSNLSRLEISWTGVSGPVPSSLGALKKLAQLNLSFNSLSGAIPVSLGTIPGITLSRNRLTGAILNMFLGESAGRDVYLDVSHNNLTGAIPAEFAAVNFTHLDLSRNALTGDASGLFGRGKELQYIDLSRNAFDFDLSGVVVLPEKLFHLDLRPQCHPWQHPGAGRGRGQPAGVQRQLQQALRHRAHRREHGEVRSLQLPAQQVPLRCSPPSMQEVDRTVRWT